MRGILTPTDEELLKKEKIDTSDRAEEQQQVRLRRRIRRAITDFPILLENSEKEDYQTIFTPTQTKETQGDINFGTTAALGFLYRGIEQNPNLDFEHMIEQAIIQSEVARGNTAEVNANIEIDRTQLKEVTELSAECPSCGRKVGMKFNRKTDAALFSGDIAADCSHCNETGIQLSIPEDT